MTRQKTVQIIPPLGHREQVIDHSFISAKGIIKIPDEVEIKVQIFLNRKRVSSPIGLLWDDMNWSHCHDYLFTIMVIQPQKMNQKFEETPETWHNW